MRAAIFSGLILALTTVPAPAEETLPLLQVGSVTYTNVTVTTVTPTDIFFTSAGGMGNVKLKQLSPELQKHFGYDHQAADAAAQRQAAANAQYRSQAANQPKPRPPADETPAQNASAAAGSDSSWSTDLPNALNQARSEHKMVLLDFTGSDWCGWCIKFDHDVLSTDRFASYAKSKLVLVKVDFPSHKPQDSSLKETNAKLKRRFQVEGFPTFVLLNFAGKELGRQVGYSEGGPGAFISKLDDFSK